MIRRFRLTLLSAALSLIAITMVAGSAASAGVLYSDGPVNGTYDSWTINSSYQVEDSFSLAAPSTLTGVTFGNWLYNDTASTVDWSIVSTEGSQTPICGTCSGVASLTAGASFGNSFGYTVVDQSFSLPDLSLGAGTYWLELYDDVTSDGFPSGWDMNGGSSLVWESFYGDVSGANCTAALGNASGSCSNSFAILGSPIRVPEPISLTLFGAGLLGLGFISRRHAVRRIGPFASDMRLVRSKVRMGA